MNKKYLSLEEAANFLGISTDKLKKHREQGDIRGFADRATWKFRLQDVEEFGRTMQATSNPEVPILSGKDKPDSSVFGNEEEATEGPTMIRDDSVFDDDVLRGPSDSDVRLVLDEELASHQKEADMLGLGDSDSDVRLAEDAQPKSLSKSDSDVKLVSANKPGSGVALVGDTQPFKLENSDSDVKLVGSGPLLKGKGSDSDVALVTGGSGIFDDEESLDTEGMTMAAGSGILNPADSGISLEIEDSGKGLEGIHDSGPGLHRKEDSGITLDLNEASGVSLEKDDDIQLSDDSGFTWDTQDSGIALQVEDSGIGLESAKDSGISLVDDDEEDVVTLSNDSGISLEKDDLNQTVPMLGGKPKKKNDLDATQMEVPLLKDEDEDMFDVGLLDDNDGTDFDMPAVKPNSKSAAPSDTGVIVFDDDDGDDYSPTVVKGKGKGKQNELAGDAFDLSDPDGEFDAADDFGGGFDDDATMDVVADDDEMDDLDVWDAGDDNFDEGFSSGASHAAFTPSAGPMVMVPAQQAEWGMGTFLSLLGSCALLGVAFAVMFDLMRSMWGWSEPSAVSNVLLDSLRGLF